MNTEVDTEINVENMRLAVFGGTFLPITDMSIKFESTPNKSNRNTPSMIPNAYVTCEFSTKRVPPRPALADTVYIYSDTNKIVLKNIQTYKQEYVDDNLSESVYTITCECIYWDILRRE